MELYLLILKIEKFKIINKFQTKIINILFRRMIMKKIISFLLIAVFSCAMFSACGEQKVTEVTDENVAELFRPSFEAWQLFAGSAFYDIEKDENGDPVVYMYSDDTFTGESYKIITDITPEEIYAKKLEYCNTGTDEERAKSSFLSCFYEKDGELYVKGAFSGMAPIYDLNSIELYNTEDDKYYILVDSYSNGINSGYSSSNIFVTTLKENGILFIEDALFTGDGVIEKDESEINEPDKRDYLGMFDKFSRSKSVFEEEVKSLFENAVDVLIRYSCNYSSDELKEDFENFEVDKSEPVMSDSNLQCYKTNLEYEEVKNKYSEYFSGQLLDDFMTAYFYNDDGTLCVYDSAPIYSGMSIDGVSAHLYSSQLENGGYMFDVLYSYTEYNPNSVVEEDRTVISREATFVFVEMVDAEYRISEIEHGRNAERFYPVVSVA